MTKGYVRDTQSCDIVKIALHMRPEDVAEVKALSGRSPHTALLEGWTIEGAITKTVCLGNGLPCAIYGVVPTDTPKAGFIWMLAADNFIHLKRQFVRETRRHINDLCKDYDLVYNFTDARNAMHHKWIKYAGFSIIKEHAHFGVEQRPFYEFAKIVEKS
jgi:hypothetical protein